MLKQEHICPACVERLEQQGYPVVDTLRDIIKLYSIRCAPVIFQMNKRNEPILAYLEKCGYIVSTEFRDMKKIILVLPKGNFRESEEERIFCFKDCAHD